MQAAQSRPIGARAGRKAGLAALMLVALAASGCMRKGDPASTGSISTASAAAEPNSQEAWRAYSEEWGRRYEAKPGDKQASLNYARALGALDQRQQAVAVLQEAALKAPRDTEVLAAFGKALVANGDVQQAREVLARAHTPDRPDWRILSAQGVVDDQLGDHATAQNLYNAALKIVPNEPGVLANLGLSYALDRKLPQAEATLRLAASQPGADVRVRQNLALVLGLQGKYAEAEAMARRDLSPVDAGQSVASLKQMAQVQAAPGKRRAVMASKASQQDTWAQIRAADAAAAAAGVPTDDGGVTEVPVAGRPPGAPLAAADQGQ
jgi:Flp pilus assembly protein TadD